MNSMGVVLPFCEGEEYQSEVAARPVVFGVFLGNSCRGGPMKGGVLEGF